ncbi:MAG TPA: LamG domain-containing protein [Chitinophagaceae bacterium]|nr:LamG domain-containing protein [Chitinophagaceae bacterium]
MKFNQYVKMFAVIAVIASLAISCQKMERPDLGEYPEDSNPPGGPLKFYSAFDGTTDNVLMNAVDSIRATFPSDNPLTQIDGVSGKGLQGVNKKYLKFIKPNDWALLSESFTISVWYKKDGQTKNNTGGNGPEYLASFKSSNGHWSGSSMLLFLEGDNAKGAVKVMIADANVADSWFTWEGSNTIAGLLDNKWHHLVITYLAESSTMTLYIDGVANANTRVWTNHGKINFDNDAITEFRIGSGPQDNFDTDDWLSSTFKGSIDQFRMYSTALSASEIQGLFNGKK